MNAEAGPLPEAMTCWDAFVDLSTDPAGGALLEQWTAAADGEGGGARLTVALPPGAAGTAPRPGLLAASEAPPKLLHRAIRHARDARRHLLVCLGGEPPNSAVMQRLLAVFRHDPMLGVAQPRFRDLASGGIWPLPTDPGRGSPAAPLPEAVLRDLPRMIVAPELPATCQLLRWEALLSLREPDEAQGLGLVAALRLVLVDARRRGFRTAIVNDAVLRAGAAQALAYPVPPEAERALLLRRRPDIARAESWAHDLMEARLERLLAARPGVATGAPRLLLDGAGLQPRHNGTAACILGFLHAFDGLETNWETDALIPPAAAAFHGLDKSLHRVRVVSEPSGTFAAALRLSQPWQLSDVERLHRAAPVLALTMLDTIAWDIVYMAGVEVDWVWRFLARHVDGFLYNSAFTRDRFRLRFPPAPEVEEVVAGHSLAAEDYVDPRAVGLAPAGHVLVLGNELDHKDLGPTLRLLARAFPFTRILALGAGQAPSPLVEVLPGGETAPEVLERAVATAAAVVFPSWYEGFGLPVVHALAYGRPVIARRSPLWRELADRCRLPGRLAEFDDDLSLVEAVGRALAGDPPGERPDGRALGSGEAPPDWRACARRALALVERLAARTDGQRWLRREEALRLLRQP